MGKHFEEETHSIIYQVALEIRVIQFDKRRRGVYATHLQQERLPFLNPWLVPAAFISLITLNPQNPGRQELSPFYRSCNRVS